MTDEKKKQSDRERAAKYRAKIRAEKGITHRPKEVLESPKNSLVTFEEQQLEDIKELVTAGLANSKNSFVRRAVDAEIKRLKKKLERQ